MEIGGPIKVCKRISALTCALSFEELGFRVDRSFFLIKNRPFSTNSHGRKYGFVQDLQNCRSWIRVENGRSYPIKDGPDLETYLPKVKLGTCQGGNSF